MLVEDRLAGDGVEFAAGGHHPVGAAAAEPEPARSVQVAQVAHPVPDRAAVGDLGQRVLPLVMVVARGHHRSLDHDLADLPGRKFPYRCPVGDGARRRFR